VCGREVFRDSKQCNDNPATIVHVSHELLWRQSRRWHRYVRGQVEQYRKEKHGVEETELPIVSSSSDSDMYSKPSLLFFTYSCYVGPEFCSGIS
jgi:hypothetical protein